MKDSNLKSELIEAIANKDVVKLEQLKEQFQLEGFLNKYVGKDGTGSIPPEAFINELPKFLAK